MTHLVAALKTEALPVQQLLGMGAPYNPRRIDPVQLAALQRSLRTFGAVEPVVANRRSGRIVGGHQRVRAAEAEGIETLPVVWVDLDETGEKQLNLALNRISGEWDEPALAALLEELGSSALDLTGFDSAEVDELIARMKREARAVDPDEVPEPPKVAVTKPGDLYVLGKHRLLCGDATKAEDVARVLCDAQPTLLVTDPPYGVKLDPTWRDGVYNKLGPGAKPYMTEGHGNRTLSGDTRVDWSEAFALVPSLEVAYVWHAGVFACEVGAGLKGIGFEIRSQIIWAKSHFAMGRGAYNWQHEPCWFAVRKGKTSSWIGDHGASTIWALASPKMIMGGSTEAKFDHPAQKPIGCMQIPMGNHSGDVFEPFAGSGTTLIAAEQLGRRCYALEIDPIYCDVIVARWQNFTGQKATLEKAAA